MNISYKWLLEYVDTSLNAQEVADALTSIGLEVDSLEEVQTIKGGLEGLWTAEILECVAHPNSDHMHVCKVDVGQEEPLQIVCGAPNVAAGQKVVVALIGTKLYQGDECFTIKKSKLRGVESFGMICAEDEIGVGTDHSGIIVLPPQTPVGIPAARYYHVESDYLIEIDITPNRADACSHYGVARDLYAWLVQNGYKTALHRPDDSQFVVDNHDLPIEIEIKNAEACPRYAAVSLTHCEVKESPEWLQNKLRTIGIRPINNIVDITNYIMMAYGQPLHCFDADMIKGNKVVVQTLPEGTPFETLDGVTHKLSDRDLAICNAEDPMCIAGVLGGRGSGTYENTVNILLESAYFNPTWIRKSARRHGLSTDASFRFERGIDPNGQVYALKQAAILAKELAGAKVSMEIKDIYPTPMPDYRVNLKYDYVEKLIGKKIPAAEIRDILKSLEIQVIDSEAFGLELQVPAYRVDVQRPCDVVEEILRIYGYNNVEIPTTLKSSLSVKGEEDKSYKLQNLVAEQLVGCGFQEILNNSLQKGAYYQQHLSKYQAKQSVTLLNPLSQELNTMRQTLLFGGLESISRNVSYRNQDLKFFEFGNVYQKKAVSDTDKQLDVLQKYSEQYNMGIWVTGKRVNGSWAHPDEDSSYAELKAYVLNIFTRIGVPMGAIVFKDGDNNIFEKSQVIESRDHKVLVEMGIVSPQLLEGSDIENPIYYAEINWNGLMKIIKKQKVSYQEISKYPAVSRDLALLLDKDIEFVEIEKIAYQTEKKYLKSVKLFDVYEGKNLPEGKKSYAVNFILQDNEKTLTDKQIDKIMQKLIAQIKSQLKAELR